MNFYKQMTDYLDRLQESYYEERDDDPTSSKTIMLEDELNKAQKRASQIYEHRERKMVLLALQVANGGAPDLMLLTVEEKKGFDMIVDILSENRIRILLKNEEDKSEPKTVLMHDEKHTEMPAAKELNDKKESQAKKEIAEKEVEKKIRDKMKDNFDKENSVLLILEDIPSFETGEGTFNLKKDDTITLSKKFAEVLCKHKKARVIEG
jgi:DNA replication initiation complex subunit (GINS family)